MNTPPSALTPSHLVLVLAMGFYVWGGELLWIFRRTTASLLGRPAPAAWRQRQISRRKQLFRIGEHA